MLHRPENKKNLAVLSCPRSTYFNKSKQSWTAAKRGLLRKVSHWYEMPDGEVRQKFLTYCKKQFHAQEDQKKFQQRDLTATDVRGRTGPKLVRIRKKSRFDSERARRGGTLDIWRMISFTGACDPALLKELEKEPAQGRTGLAPTPWVTREAKEARKRLKYVLRLDNKQKQ